MTGQSFSNPELHLRDRLYDLQALRELADKSMEVALIGEDIHETCNVFTDLYTGDRIITTKLPVDEARFSGAKVLISNMEYGVEIDSEELDVLPHDVIFAIDRALRVKRVDPQTGQTSPFDVAELAKRICVPRIKPAAVSEIDEREPPLAYELLSTPEKYTYTLASGMYDRHLEERVRLIVKTGGILNYGVGKSTTFDAELYEMLPKKDEIRLTEFDREFAMWLRTGDEMSLTATPWGQEEIIGRGKQFKFKIHRGGIIVDMVRNDKIVHCTPGEDAVNIVNSILENGQYLD